VLLLKRKVTGIISESNIFLLDTMTELASLFESGKYNNGNYDDLINYREKIKLKHNYYKKQINDCMIRLLRIAERQRLSQLVFS
jgi:hypothetical protein